MGGMTPNRLIANIPEHPNEYDFFNIPNLQNNDGRMDPAWINLYGPLPHERITGRTKGMKDGSAYMGRILMSMNIIPCEIPTIAQNSMSGSSKEPR